MSPHGTGVPPVEFDIFLSLGGPDRVEVNLLKEALVKEGLTVFVDQDDIRHFEGITQEIERCLRSSRTLLAYYSSEYPLRSACQFELTAALLAGRNEQDPTRRIIVVNPEATEDHIQPAYLSDARFAVRPGSDRERKALAALIKQKVDTVEGPLSSIAFTRRPRWFAFRIAGAPGFVGRYRELWELDSLLTKAALPLTQDTSFGPVAVVTGAARVGKSSLVADYAWQFGAAFRSGVYWIDMSGVEGAVDQVLAAYADRVRAIAAIAGLNVAGLGPEQMFSVLGEHLAAAPEPSLWIVDGLSAGLGGEAPHRMIIPAGDRVQTVFVGRRDPFGGAIPAMVLGGLSRTDARELLGSYRKPVGEREEAARDELADRLGGHAGALVLAGGRLKDRQGLRSYVEMLADFDAAADVDRFFGALVRESIGELDTAQTLVLAVASVCAAAGIPAGLLAQAVATLAHDGIDASAVGDALRGLQEAGLAASDDGRWSISAIAREQAREQNPPGPRRRWLQTVVAGALAPMLQDAATSLGDRPALVTHAVRMCGEADRNEDVRWLVPLLERLAEHYEVRGEGASASVYRDRLLDIRGENTSDLLYSARAAQTAREFDKAAGLAQRALAAARSDGPQVRRCRLLVAEALDGALRFQEAEMYWDQVVVPARAGDAGEQAERAAESVAHARSRIRRGELRKAKQALKSLIEEYARSSSDVKFTVADAVGDQIRGARIEYAHVLTLIGDQIEARRVASEVVAFYRQDDLLRHADMVRAQEILAEATIVPHIRELSLDDTARARAEQDMKQLWQKNCEEDGPRSPSALSAGVGYGHALVSQGRKEQARDMLVRLRADAVAIRGPRDPVYLRATFLLGQSYAQMKCYRKALEMFREAFDNQREVLGPSHPYTLASGFELAVMYKSVGEDAKAAKMIREQDALSAKSIEYSNDLRAQIKVAGSLIALIPSPLWRWMRGPERDC